MQGIVALGCVESDAVHRARELEVGELPAGASIAGRLQGRSSQEDARDGDEAWQGQVARAGARQVEDGVTVPNQVTGQLEICFMGLHCFLLSNGSG